MSLSGCISGLPINSGDRVAVFLLQLASPDEEEDSVGYIYSDYILNLEDNDQPLYTPYACPIFGIIDENYVINNIERTTIVEILETRLEQPIERIVNKIGRKDGIGKLSMTVEQANVYDEIVKWSCENIYSDLSILSFAKTYAMYQIYYNIDLYDYLDGQPTSSAFQTCDGMMLYTGYDIKTYCERRNIDLDFSRFGSTAYDTKMASVSDTADNQYKVMLVSSFLLPVDDFTDYIDMGCHTEMSNFSAFMQYMSKCNRPFIPSMLQRGRYNNKTLKHLYEMSLRHLNEGTGGVLD